MFIVPAEKLVGADGGPVYQIGRALDDIRNANLALELKDELAGRRQKRNRQQFCRRRRQCEHGGRVRRKGVAEVGSGDGKSWFARRPASRCRFPRRCPAESRRNRSCRPKPGKSRLTATCPVRVLDGILIDGQNCHAAILPPDGIRREQRLIAGGGNHGIARLHEILHEFRRVIGRIIVRAFQ